jgi:DNA-binding NtrC family response regulator
VNAGASRSILLVSENEACLDFVASELRAMGFRVFCTRDLAEAAELVRQGVTRRFVLVRIGARHSSPNALRDEMAAHLQDYLVEGEDVPEDNLLN